MDTTLLSRNTKVEKTMAKQPTISVSITASEARSILQGHMLDLGRRTEEFGNRDTFAFMIEASLKSVRHWKHIIEQFEAIEKLERAPGISEGYRSILRNKIAAKFSNKELKKLTA